MPTIEEMLRIAKEAGASDVHITVGVPPKMRVNGKLITMDFDKMLPNDTGRLIDEIMNEKQRAFFEERGNTICPFPSPIWADTVSMPISREDRWQLPCVW